MITIRESIVLKGRVIFTSSPKPIKESLFNATLIERLQQLRMIEVVEMAQKPKSAPENKSQKPKSAPENKSGKPADPDKTEDQTGKEG